MWKPRNFGVGPKTLVSGTLSRKEFKEKTFRKCGGGGGVVVKVTRMLMVDISFSQVHYLELGTEPEDKISYPLHQLSPLWGNPSNTFS
jgi:hypothetical protein